MPRKKKEDGMAYIRDCRWVYENLGSDVNSDEVKEAAPSPGAYEMLSTISGDSELVSKFYGQTMPRVAALEQKAASEKGNRDDTRKPIDLDKTAQELQKRANEIIKSRRKKAG